MSNQEELRMLAEGLRDLQEIASETGRTTISIVTIEHWLALLAKAEAPQVSEEEPPRNWGEMFTSERAITKPAAATEAPRVSEEQVRRDEANAAAQPAAAGSTGTNSAGPIGAKLAPSLSAAAPAEAMNCGCLPDWLAHGVHQHACKLTAQRDHELILRGVKAGIDALRHRSFADFRKREPFSNAWSEVAKIVKKSNDALDPEAIAKQVEKPKRLPCGCEANNYGRCPVHDCP